MKTHVVTTFDKNHVHRALTMRYSLLATAPDVHVYFMCLDDVAYAMMNRLQIPNATVWQISDIADHELEAVLDTRTRPEFASTMKPALLRYMVKSGRVGKDELLAFIDPDIHFFIPPQELFEHIFKSGSIVITPHRFPKNKESEALKKGIYNAGMVFFRNDEHALKCLEEWRLQCIEWCYLRYEDGKIGDQGYLTDWPQKYKNVYLLEDKGVNLSTWNIEQYRVWKKDGKFWIDEFPLICYHYHAYKMYLTGTRVRSVPVSVYHLGIYREYVDALQITYNKILALDPTWQFGFVPNPGILRIIKQSIWRLFR